MSDILNEIRQHLIDLKIVNAKELKNNFVDASPEVTSLWVYGGYKEVIGTSPTIQIKTLSVDPVKAQKRIQAIFDALISNQPNRISTINNKKMKVVESQQPFFQEKDTQQRFVWVFNITVTAF